MTNRNNAEFPPYLRKRIPSLAFALFVEMRWVGSIFGAFMIFGAAFGPLVGPRGDQNGFIFFLAPSLCPLLIAAIAMRYPYNPYLGLEGIWGEFSSDGPLDEDCRRLIAVYNSPRRRRFLIWLVVKLSGGLYGLLWGMSIWLGIRFDWSLTSDRFIMGLVYALIGAILVVGTEYVHWGMIIWRNEFFSKKT